MSAENEMHFSIINQPLLELFKDFGNEFALELLEQFILQTRQMTEKLKFSFDQEDHNGVLLIVMKLKEASQELGFFKLSHHCLVVEEHAGRGGSPEMPFLIISLIEETGRLEKSIGEIRSLLGGSPAD